MTRGPTGRAAGFESIWLFDHFHTVPRPTDEITFESFTSLSALAAVTTRVRLGHVVICTAFRNPALTAKMISTMDVISGGRMELGIGAGWKRDEWLAYGYGFPETRERLARLGDDLEVIEPDAGRRQAPARDLRGQLLQRRGRAQHPQADPAAAGPDHGRRQRPERDLAPGRQARRRAQPRRDVAGRGRPRRCRSIRARCEEIGRDPATLAISVHMWGSTSASRASSGSTGWPGYRELGVSRVMGLVRTMTTDDDGAAALIEDARAAGVEVG